jgi:hypothetical protein
MAELAARAAAARNNRARCAADFAAALAVIDGLEAAQGCHLATLSLEETWSAASTQRCTEGERLLADVARDSRSVLLVLEQETTGLAEQERAERLTSQAELLRAASQAKVSSDGSAHARAALLAAQLSVQRALAENSVSEVGLAAALGSRDAAEREYTAVLAEAAQAAQAAAETYKRAHTLAEDLHATTFSEADTSASDNNDALLAATQTVATLARGIARRAAETLDAAADVLRKARAEAVAGSAVALHISHHAAPAPFPCTSTPTDDGHDAVGAAHLSAKLCADAAGALQSDFERLAEARAARESLNAAGSTRQSMLQRAERLAGSRRRAIRTGAWTAVDETVFTARAALLAETASISREGLTVHSFPPEFRLLH